jgi:hypothetical protein
LDEALTQELIGERDGLLREIDAAFDGVSREGGVSWSESRVLDDQGTPAERAAARSRDREEDWRQLVDDPGWVVDPGSGGFYFLDPIGFRYYLPAAMVRCVVSGQDEGVLPHLTVYPGQSSRPPLAQWSRLDMRQRRCVARFLRYMHLAAVHSYRDFRADWWDPAFEKQGLVWDTSWSEQAEWEGWSTALDGYWGRIDQVE